MHTRSRFSSKNASPILIMMMMILVVYFFSINTKYSLNKNYVKTHQHKTHFEKDLQNDRKKMNTNNIFKKITHFNGTPNNIKTP